jgi:hypothetical protein
VSDSAPSFVPKLTPTKISTATTYHFSTEPRSYGWALATVNDETGELSIQSDWGHWAYQWSPNPNHLGSKTLTHFLGQRGDVHYVAQKLTTREERDRFDPDATVRAMRSAIARRRMIAGRDYRVAYGAPEPEWYSEPLYGDRLSKNLARELWEALSDLRDVDNVTLFLERFNNIEGANDHIHERPWEGLEHSPRTGYLVLLHGILPALRDACAARVRIPADATRDEATP